MSPRPLSIVIGAGFGEHYARALAGPSSPAELVAVVGQGGPRSASLARDLGVGLWSMDRLDAALARHPVDVAVVAVRSAVVGGPGDELAAALLDRGIPVLQELPIHTRSILESTRRASRSGTVLRPTAFYDRLAPVTRFAGMAAELTAHEHLDHVVLRTCRQTLHDALLVLSAVVTGPPPRAVEVTNHGGTAHAFCDWAGVPVDILIENRLDPRDPDAFSQPLMSFILTTAAGELELGQVHGPTRWTPVIHRRQAGRAPDGSATTAHGEEPSVAEILSVLWPAAIRAAVVDLLDRARRGLPGISQRELAVLSLWERLCAGLSAAQVIGTPAPDAVLKLAQR